jgi:hypothetical protein
VTEKERQESEEKARYRNVPEKVAIARGVCSRCYGEFRRNVARGDYTWDDLERLGSVTPKYTGKG